MEFLFELLGEILLQILFEAGAELGLHALGDTFRRRHNPILSTLGFLLWGALAGGISLLVFPHSMIHQPWIRLFNLFITPLAAGSAMMLLARLRTRRGQMLVGLDRFGYAFSFALAMALVRYSFTT